MKRDSSVIVGEVCAVRKGELLEEGRKRRGKIELYLEWLEREIGGLNTEVEMAAMEGLKRQMEKKNW